MTRLFIAMALSLVAVLLLSGVGAHDIEDEPCVKETRPLMTASTTWPDITKAVAVLPSSCFSGYFAEGISDTIVRKMGSDWPGFLEVLKMSSSSDNFLSLVLKSINATLNPDDIQLVNRLSIHSCPKSLATQCAEISARAREALADFSPPIGVQP